MSLNLPPLTDKESYAIDSIRKFEYEKAKEIAGIDDISNEDALKWDWSWYDVRVAPQVLNSLFIKGYINCTYNSNSQKRYRINDDVLNSFSIKQDHTQDNECREYVISDDIFSNIIGYIPVKRLLLACLKADKQVHVLLSGPPAIAKSMFLWEVEKVVGNEAMWILGSDSSKAGIIDAIASREPKYLLVDELDKMKSVDTWSLLSIMEGGRITRTKHGSNIDKNIPLKVIAATNREDRLPRELLSRFAIRRLSPYTDKEFIDVVISVLSTSEDINIEDAENIAHKLVGKTQNIRDAIRVARISKSVGVNDAIELLFT